MIHPSSQTRSGITLTEILIAILIMGVGFVSVGTLFPIGLHRMREATRFSRSTLLAQSAAEEVNSRDLLNGPSFMAPGLSWYAAKYAGLTTWPYAYSVFAPNPWNKDVNIDPNTGNIIEAATPGVFAEQYQPGLPVVYDPLFWSLVHYNSAADTPQITPENYEGRFGSGVGFIGNSPSGQRPAADGLQRITNFRPYATGVSWPLTYSMPSTPPALLGVAEVAGEIFASPDDPVFQEPAAGGENGSPLVPADFDPGVNYAPLKSWDFTWMVTARRASAGDSSTYEANIVLFHKRATGVEFVPDPNGTTRTVASGERAVEAVWGHTNAIAGIDTDGYSLGDDRVVLLRWPLTSPDPNVRVGGWIADVTYDRGQVSSTARYGPGISKYRGQRCIWYRIAQITETEADTAYPGHRRMIVRVETPVQAKTRLTVSGGQVVPVVPETALVCPYVVNVYTTLLYSR